MATGLWKRPLPSIGQAGLELTEIPLPLSARMGVECVHHHTRHRSETCLTKERASGSSYFPKRKLRLTKARRQG